MFLPVGENVRSTPQDEGRDENLNFADDTICGVFPAGSPRLGRKEQERLSSTHSSEREPEVESYLEEQSESP